MSTGPVAAEGGGPHAFLAAPERPDASYHPMHPLEQGRPPTPSVQVLLGVLLAGTMLYLVPALALSGRTLAAIIAAVIWAGGIAALWLAYRRDLRHFADALDRERAGHALYARLVEHGAEAYLVLGPHGRVTFISPNVERILGADPDRLERQGGLLELIRRSERRRVLQEFAKARRQPGASVSLELVARLPDGTDHVLDVRATNLADDAAVGGILVSARDITPRKTFESEIQHLAYYDALTGLANRRFFFEQGANALALARRHRQQVAVLYVDLDRFQQLNATLGHENGDEVLQNVAGVLRRALRDTDVVARLGGDEFAAILTEVRDEDAAGRVAHRILDGLGGALVAPGHEVPVRASIGVAMFPEDGRELEALLKAADLAMYRAKTEEVGVQFYRPELRSVLTDQMRLEQDMRRALEHHEFHLHYQPVFHIMTGEMVGAEALSRWRHFTRGMVAAREFIELAERSGLVRSLDRWAIARAIHQRKTQLDGGWIGWVAVNLSPQSLTDPELPRFLRDAMEHAGLEPGSLVVEMPEGAVLRDTAAAADLMWEIKNTGVGIALDDYGVGATSFAQLKKLPIDILKLHPGFVRGIGEDAGDEYLVEATISIAHGIRAKVLAKGVELDRQVDWLRDAGCDFIQGYLMGPPVPLEDLAAGVHENAGE